MKCSFIGRHRAKTSAALLVWLIFLSAFLIEGRVFGAEQGGTVAAAPIAGPVAAIFPGLVKPAKVYLVNCSAVWCVTCLNEIPMYNALYQKFHSRGLAVVELEFWADSKLSLSDFVKNHAIQYIVVPGSIEVANRVGEIRGFPTTYVLTADGSVRERFVGPREEKKAVLEKLIERLLTNSR